MLHYISYISQFIHNLAYRKSPLFKAALIAGTLGASQLANQNPPNAPINSAIHSENDSIVFERYAKKVLKWEGTLEDWKKQPLNALDRGGITNLGITKITYFGLCSKVLNKAPTDSGFVHLSPFEAHQFLQFFANQVGWDSINNFPARIIITDIAWGCGIYGCYAKMRKFLKDYGYNIAQGYKKFDSEFYKWLNILLAQFPSKNVVWTLSRYRREWVEEDIKRNPEQKAFRNGWINRINDLENFLEQYIDSK